MTHIFSQGNTSDTNFYYCKTCRITFPNQMELQSHSLKHYNSSINCNDAKTEIQTGKYSCKLCAGVSFKFGNDLNKHISTQHKTTDGYYNCNICDKTFSERRYLRIHLKRHSGVRNHKCDVCDWAFFEPNKLKLHMETHKETMEKKLPYKCDICSYQFHNRAGLRDHLNTHSGDRPYPCSLCSATFAHRVGLHRHQAVHCEDRQYKCGVCDKGFKFKSKLQEHTVTHTNDSGFCCQNCNRAFGSVASLKRHLLKRSCQNGKISTVFVCGACKFRFKSRSLVESHKCQGRVTETGGVSMEDAIFMCSACGTIFKHLDKADSHVCNPSPNAQSPIDEHTSITNDSNNASQSSPMPTAISLATVMIDANGNTVSEANTIEIVQFDNAVCNETDEPRKQEITVTSIQPVVGSLQQYDVTSTPAIADIPYKIHVASTGEVVYMDIEEKTDNTLVLNNSTGNYISLIDDGTLIESCNVSKGESLVCDQHCPGQGQRCLPTKVETEQERPQTVAQLFARLESTVEVGECVEVISDEKQLAANTLADLCSNV